MGLFRPTRVAHAHCGVYDPAQAMIEAKSVLNACTKYAASEDPVFRDRCILIKEERAELVKHHLSVLWTDFFKPHHLEAHPDLHDKFWKATKLCSAVKVEVSVQHADELMAAIKDIHELFWAAKNRDVAWYTAS